MSPPFDPTFGGALGRQEACLVQDMQDELELLRAVLEAAESCLPAFRGYDQEQLKWWVNKYVEWRNQC